MVDSKQHYSLFNSENKRSNEQLLSEMRLSDTYQIRSNENKSNVALVSTLLSDSEINKTSFLFTSKIDQSSLVVVLFAEEKTNDYFKGRYIIKTLGGQIIKEVIFDSNGVIKNVIQSNTKALMNDFILDGDHTSYIGCIKSHIEILWDDLGWLGQTLIEASCGSCLFGGNPVGCGTCAVTAGGIGFGTALACIALTDEKYQ